MTPSSLDDEDELHLVADDFLARELRLDAVKLEYRCKRNESVGSTSVVDAISAENLQHSPMMIDAHVS